MLTLTNERGVTLLVTLALLTVLTMLLLSLDESTRQGVRIVKTNRALALTTIAADGGIALARTLLEEDAARNPYSDHLLEPWAQPIAPFPLGDVTVTVAIEDVLGRMDLNALVDPRGNPIQGRIEQAKRLFLRIGAEPQLVDLIVDWIDPDNAPMPLGRERDGTGGPTGAYRPHNAPLATLGELQGIPGFSSALIAKLRPYVIAGRAVDPSINLNTAAPEVLEALHPNFSSTLVAQLLQARPILQISDLDRLTGLAPVLTALRSESNNGFTLAVRSPYYRATATGTLAQTTLQVEAFLVRQGTDVNILQLTTF